MLIPFPCNRTTLKELSGKRSCPNSYTGNITLYEVCTFVLNCMELHLKYIELGGNSKESS